MMELKNESNMLIPECRQFTWKSSREFHCRRFVRCPYQVYRGYPESGAKWFCLHRKLLQWKLFQIWQPASIFLSEREGYHNIYAADS